MAECGPLSDAATNSPRGGRRIECLQVVSTLSRFHIGQERPTGTTWRGRRQNTSGQQSPLWGAVRSGYGLRGSWNGKRGLEGDPWPNPYHSRRLRTGTAGAIPPGRKASATRTQRSAPDPRSGGCATEEAHQETRSRSCPSESVSLSSSSRFSYLLNRS